MPTCFLPFPGFSYKQNLQYFMWPAQSHLPHWSSPLLGILVLYSPIPLPLFPACLLQPKSTNNDSTTWYMTELWLFTVLLYAMVMWWSCSWGIPYSSLPSHQIPILLICFSLLSFKLLLKSCFFKKGFPKWSEGMWLCLEPQSTRTSKYHFIWNKAWHKSFIFW